MGQSKIQKPTYFPHEHGRGIKINTHVRKMRRAGDPVFVPCGDNYRFEAIQETTVKQILKA